MVGEGISERRVEIRVRKNGRKDKVIVEKSAAKGLPEGWIKKLEISNRSGRKLRRDPFFIDPKSGYIFHSFKDASRYVETGDIGIYARKVKESSIEDDDSGNGNPIRSADDLLEKEKKIGIHARKSKRRNLPSSDEPSKNCKMNSDLSIITSQVLEDGEKKEEAKDPIEKQPIMKRVTRSQAKAIKNEEFVELKRNNPSLSNAKSEKDSLNSRLSGARSQEPIKESVMKEEEEQDSTKKRITRSKAKVKTNELSNSGSRRTSKRLAGIELEPTPELKTRTKVQRRVPPPDDEQTPEFKTGTKAPQIIPPDDGAAGKCKQPMNPVATSGLKETGVPLNKEPAKSHNIDCSQKPYAAAAAPTSNNRVSAEMAVGIKKIRKSVGRKPSREKKTVLTPPIIYELNPVFHLDGYKQKEEMSPVSPLACETSAMKWEKTAAGKRLGQSSPNAKLATSVKATEISALGSSNKGKYPHPCDSGNAIQRRNKLGNELPNSSVVRGACSEVMEKNTNSFSSAYNSTIADLWKDPCIAFAIETLTGESLRLPNTIAISSDHINNHTKQEGVSFIPETPGNVNTCSENPGASPSADIWKDPCIDFAIKTLTGAIPIGLDEPDVKSKTEGTTIATAATPEPGGRQSNCDHLAQQKNKTVVGKGDLCAQSLSKD
ncbi:hypothetical protein CARUB_v10026033mg [Capsella rubella]|uniref:MBD domain-containing protein n=1 Tax=Capsella rubella TaxID=81985 RepID=R0EUP0_9BRAS|nr:hypothetical protein CARUB_v10026033mg [Capsella rubella]